MTQAKRIRALIEKVKAGELNLKSHKEKLTLVSIFRGETKILDFLVSAYRGDETAAFALMREVLGDRWRVMTIQQVTPTFNWFVALKMNTEPSKIKLSPRHKSLPIALLLATLEARLFELENEDEN